MHGNHLAHLNIARMRAPLEAPLMAEFVAQLDIINALADESPGFVWRLKDEDPNDPAVLALGSDMLINLSVWLGTEALANFVYRSAHAGVMRRRREWFAPLQQPYVVLWWIEAGTVPTIAEAVGRLRHLQTYGASPRAFTLHTPLPPEPASRPA
jgi:Domain of unknown function (DUF3291)